jgi:hypothetical protein
VLLSVWVKIFWFMLCNSLSPINIDYPNRNSILIVCLWIHHILSNSIWLFSKRLIKFSQGMIIFLYSCNYKQWILWMHMSFILWNVHVSLLGSSFVHHKYLQCYFYLNLWWCIVIQILSIKWINYNTKVDDIAITE